MIRLSTIAITLFTTLVVIIFSFSVSAQSSAAQIENEYNRMIAEQHTKLQQTEAAIQEARNEIYRLQSDPTHSESNLISEQKWLEVLLRDRESILRTISNLNQQKSLAIQNQKDLENSVRQAAEKAKREKRKADQQKAYQKEAPPEKQPDPFFDWRNTGGTGGSDTQLGPDLQQKYSDGKEAFGRQNGGSLMRSLDFAADNGAKMAGIANNVTDMANNASEQVSQGYGDVRTPEPTSAYNPPQRRPLKSLIPAQTPDTKPKPEIFDIDNALKNSDY